MSETSSDTNGDSSFEFLNNKDSNNGSKLNQLSPILMSTTTTNSNVSTDVKTIDTTEEANDKAMVGSIDCQHKQSEELSSNPIEATTEVPLNELSSSPKSRSNSMSSGFIEWITNNEFISKVAEKAKNSMDTMITTLDPGMKPIIYSGGDINIIVTSDKESKISPIRESFQKAFGRATISGLSSQSLSIASQPVGFESGLKAAQERIKSLRMNTSSIPQNQVIVSVENFIVDISSDKWYDIGCIVLDDPVFGINLEVYTQSTPVPNDCVNQMRFETPIDYASKSSGYAVTVGQVMSQKLNVSPEEWHEAWIGVSRKDIISQASDALANLYKNRLSR